MFGAMKSLVGAFFLLESVLGFQSSTERYLSQVSHKDDDVQYPGAAPSAGSFGGAPNNDQLISVNDVQLSSREAEMALFNQESYAMQRSSPSTTAIVKENGAMNIQALVALSKEELVVTLVNYQNWMRQYMIDAQEQKFRAVQAAEESLNVKWSEALSVLDPTAMPVVASKAPTSRLSSSQPQSPLFAARNAAVSRAGAAGKSRWGDVEVQRAATSINGIPGLSSSNAPPTASFNANIKAVAATRAVNVNNGATFAPPPTAFAASASVPVPVEVANADHGLRADGGVGGLTLAERIYFGAKAENSPSPVPASSSAPVPLNYDTMPPRRAPVGITSTTLVLSPSEILYTQRNLRLLRAAQHGASPRWGEPEVNRVSNIISFMDPEVLKTVAANVFASSSKTESRGGGGPINLGASFVSTRA